MGGDGFFRMDGFLRAFTVCCLILIAGITAAGISFLVSDDTVGCSAPVTVSQENAMLHDLAIGQYKLLADSDTRRIFPKDKHGNTRPITLVKHTLRLRHDADPGGADDVVFSHYLHQSRWLIGDSRVKGAVLREHVVSELTRMLRIERREASALVGMTLQA